MSSRNPSLIILIAMAIIAGIGFIGYAYYDSQFALVLLFVGVILGGSIFIFKKEINLWVNQRSSKTLSPKEQQYLKDNFPLLEHISTEQQPRFFKKVFLFILDKEIISQDPTQKVYHPAVLLCGAYAAFFDMKNKTAKSPFPGIPVYVFYGHPFPSPQFPKDLHISEYFEEDGAILISVPHMIKGNEEPLRYFNIVLYESARVALNGFYDSVDFPTLTKLCRFGGFTIEKFEEYFGLSRDHIQIKAFALSLYFSDTNRFTKSFPRLGALFRKEYLSSEL